MDDKIIQLEIARDEDKGVVAAILVLNGYTVRKAVIREDGWSKVVLQAKKEQPK